MRKLKVVEVSEKENYVTIAFRANLIPETCQIIDEQVMEVDGKLCDGLLMEGQSAGNYKTVRVFLKVKEDKNERA